MSQLLHNFLSDGQLMQFVDSRGGRWEVGVGRGCGRGAKVGEGVDLIKLPYLLYVIGQIGLNKQCTQIRRRDKGLCLPLTKQFYTHS